MGTTPLFAAIISGCHGVVSALLDAGADPNERVIGTPPLMMACLEGDHVATRLLLAAGANPHVCIEGKPDATPVFASASRLRLSCLLALFEAGASPFATPGATRPLDGALASFARHLEIGRIFMNGPQAETVFATAKRMSELGDQSGMADISSAGFLDGFSIPPSFVALVEERFMFERISPPVCASDDEKSV